MSLFSISSILVSLSSVLVGLFVFSQNTRSPLHRNWLAFTCVTSLWGLGLYGVTAAGTLVEAARWQHLLDISAIWIPPLSLSFALTFLSLPTHHFRYVLLHVFLYGSIGISILLTYLSFTDFYIQGFSNTLGFYWIEPGQLYFLFPLFFGLVSVVFGFVFLSEFLNTSRTSYYRKQALSIFIAALFGFGGGATNFFPQLFNIYPFGNYLVILFVFFVAYSILRQRLFQTKIIATQFFASAFGLIFLLNLLRSETIIDWTINFFILVLVAVFGVLLVGSVIKEVEQREEIERLAKDLQKANTRLKELDAMKSQFLSIASHDLRAPLTAIRNFMSLLLDGTYGTIPPAAKEGMQHVFDRATEMADSVSDYLNVSRIEQGRMKYDFVESNLHKLLSDSVAIFRNNFEQKGLELKVTLPEDKQFPVKADIGKLQEVFNNLLDNAVKYTPTGTVTVSLEKVSQDKARVTFKDSGVGMDQKTIRSLFKLFSAGENSRKINTSSTGIGLYITKKHVEAHGGRVWAESDGEGKGSRFIVELPLKA